MANHKKYRVLRPIYYKNPQDARYQTIVPPGETVTLPHLTPAEVSLLIRKRILEPTKETVKETNDD